MSRERIPAYGSLAVSVPLLAIGFIWGGFLETLVQLVVVGTILGLIWFAFLRYKGTAAFGGEKPLWRHAVEHLALLVFLGAFGFLAEGGADGVATSGALVFGMGAGYLGACREAPRGSDHRS